MKLKELLENPLVLEQTRSEEIADLRGELARIDSLLLARLVSPNGNGQAEHPAQPDRRLSVEQAAEKLGMSKDWLYRHAHGLPFTIRIGRGLGFSEAGIERYLRQRAGR